METIIDLGHEVVIDCSTIRDPYVRLWLAAVGEPLVAGSPWVAVRKRGGPLRQAAAAGSNRVPRPARGAVRTPVMPR